MSGRPNPNVSDMPFSVAVTMSTSLTEAEISLSGVAYSVSLSMEKSPISSTLPITASSFSVMAGEISARSFMLTLPSLNRAETSPMRSAIVPS